MTVVVRVENLEVPLVAEVKAHCHTRVAFVSEGKLAAHGGTARNFVEKECFHIHVHGGIDTRPADVHFEWGTILDIDLV